MTALRLRKVRPEDSPLILAWRNSASARRGSFDSRPVRRADHQAWFARKLSDRDCSLFIAEAGARAVGQVRLDRSAKRSAEISVAIAPARQGRGLGSRVLLAASVKAKSLGLSTLVARVKPENAASVVAFIKAGYRFVRREKVRGCEAYRLEKPL